MGFRVPTFNLLCDIWSSNTVPPVGPPRLSNVPCQLAWDGAGNFTFVTGLNPRHMMLLRVPLGTDLRGSLSATFQDTVEVPSGTGRYYVVYNVDDVAKGFPNEYRQGQVVAAAQPTPLP